MSNATCLNHVTYSTFIRIKQSKKGWVKGSISSELRMYALDMHKKFTNQEWNEFRIFSEKYANGKMVERAEEILIDWGLKNIRNS